MPCVGINVRTSVASDWHVHIILMLGSQSRANRGRHFKKHVEYIHTIYSNTHTTNDYPAPGYTGLDGPGQCHGMLTKYNIVMEQLCQIQQQFIRWPDKIVLAMEIFKLVTVFSDNVIVLLYRCHLLTTVSVANKLSHSQKSQTVLKQKEPSSGLFMFQPTPQTSHWIIFGPLRQPTGKVSESHQLSHTHAYIHTHTRTRATYMYTH